MEVMESGVSPITGGGGEPAGTVNINTATTTQLKTGEGKLLGFYVNSTAAGTIVINDGTAAAVTALSGTITPAVGFHRFPIDFQQGLRVVTGATIDVTFFYR